MADPIENIKDSMKNTVLSAFDQAGSKITDGMKQKLQSAGHVDTGALLNSIRYEVTDEGNKVVLYGYADAKSPQGTEYAEFIELGTGAAHGRAGGRVGSWRYQDRQGKWHTTDGMDADPFIEPSVEEVLPEMKDIIDSVIANYDIAKYGR